MAYRMRMFKSQKPSSLDLRVSDFKRIPGFNYVLEYELETGSKLREGGGRGRGVLIEKSEAIAQPQSGGRLMLLNLT